MFTLDPATGILTFGDGVHGRAGPGRVPQRGRPRLRHRGRDGRPATGRRPGVGRAQHPRADRRHRAGDHHGFRRRDVRRRCCVAAGATVRSRLRAVAASDYATLGARAPPASSVARAHCLPAHDLRLGAATVPGTVTVVVVPQLGGSPRTPPMPTPELLAAVARPSRPADGRPRRHAWWPSRPAFREIAVTALLVGAAGADLALLESTTRDRIDAWLNPTVGGDGTGWPFGGTVRWDALVRVLLGRRARPAGAVARLSFRVGGRRLPACTDVPLAPDELVWPGGHVLETQRGGGGS